MGWDAIIYLSAMAGIDQGLYEAAKVDGANRFQRIFYITLPSIKPTVIVLLIMSVGGALNVGMERQMLLSNSIVQDPAMVLSWFAYIRGIGSNNYGLGTAIGVLCTSMLAYVLSRKDFYFNKLFTVLFVITMYVGGGMIPEYLLLTRTLHMSNSVWVYILLGLIWVYNLILMRSFIEGLPMALQEAAKIDGANDFIIWFKVVLPLCTPTIATVALFYAVGQWNSFMDTYLYARELSTLQYVLYEIMEQATIQIDPHAQASQLKNAVSPMSVRMAITIVATVPILVVYPFLQKYFVGSMTLGAVKD